MTLPKFAKFLIGLLLGALLLSLPLSQFQPSPNADLERLAVQIDGRKKPLDTVAQETLTKLYGRTTYQPAEGNPEPALATYLALWFNTRNWNQEPVVLVAYRPLKEAVGLDGERKHFTFQELTTNADLVALVREARQQQVAEADLTRLQQEALTVEERLDLLYNTVSDNRLPIVPHPSDPKGTWVPMAQAATLYPPETAAPLMAEFAMMQKTLLGSPSHVSVVGTLATGLKQGLTALSPTVYPSDRVLGREVHFNHFHPFAKAWQLYALAFAVMLITVAVQPWNLYWVSMGLFTAGIGVQAYGFALRMQIAGRPPVTNMYESVVWVGFGIAALALMFELISRSRYYLLAAAPLAVVCLVLADSLPAVLDPTISPLVPVLRDNFWLSIHVPTIALSYASFALALGLGHLALGNYLLFPDAQGRIRTLSQLNYRVLQVGVLLLTAGIILGGIWAHFSWGRFWGWDPKETWALIALLCYLAPLHGRLVGWIGDFGINVASVVAFNAVLMAWYGVNFVLGTGLHSYGFGTGGSQWLIAAVVGVDLLLVLGVAIRHQGWFSPSEGESSLYGSGQEGQGSAAP